MPPIGDHACVRIPCSGPRGLDLGLGEIRVRLDLVDRRDDIGAAEQRGHVVDHEVADADRADPVIGEQRL
jgi:hypothetical protein